MSRFYDAVLRADEVRRQQQSAPAASPLGEEGLPPRPHRVVCFASNKGGVGKTTLATNLAVYARALRDDLPVLLMGFDDQQAIDRMFARHPGPPGATLLEALRSGDLRQSIRPGRYGVHYVPTSARIGELKRDIDRPGFLQSVLCTSGWRGLVVLDTKGDLEILTRNAIAASDLTLVVAKDLASLAEAEKVFDLLHEWGRPRERARVVLSMMDRRVKYAGGRRDVLSLLLEEARKRGLPVLDAFVSTSPKVEGLATNPDRSLEAILHAAPGSLVNGQLRSLTEGVLRLVLPREPAVGEARPRSEAAPLGEGMAASA